VPGSGKTLFDRDGASAVLLLVGSVSALAQSGLTQSGLDVVRATNDHFAAVRLVAIFQDNEARLANIRAEC
jgi:hypothetical protein